MLYFVWCYIFPDGWVMFCCICRIFVVICFVGISCKYCVRNRCHGCTTHFRRIGEWIGEWGESSSADASQALTCQPIGSITFLQSGSSTEIRLANIGCDSTGKSFSYFSNKYFKLFHGFFGEFFKASPSGTTPINHSLCQPYAEWQGNSHQFIKSSGHQAPRRQRGRRKLKCVQLLLSLEDLFEPLSVFCDLFIRVAVEPTGHQLAASIYDSTSSPRALQMLESDRKLQGGTRPTQKPEQTINRTEVHRLASAFKC